MQMRLTFGFGIGGANISGCEVPQKAPKGKCNTRKTALFPGFDEWQAAHLSRRQGYLYKIQPFRPAVQVNRYPVVRTLFFNKFCLYETPGSVEYTPDKTGIFIQVEIKGGRAGTRVRVEADCPHQ